MGRPTTIRTSEPRELLALIPYQLGFAPSESAVAVSLRGPRGAVGLVARVDLHDLAGPSTAGPGRHDGSGPEAVLQDEAVGVLARALVRHLVHDGASRAVLVVYTHGPLGEARTRAALVHGRLAAAGAEAGLGPLDCWVVTDSGYGALDCTDDSCCPAGGRPLADLQGTEVGAAMVLRGACVADSRDALVRIDPAPAPARRSARRAAARWLARNEQARSTTDLHRWRRDSVRLWRTELHAAQGGSAVEGDAAIAVGTGADRRPATPSRCAPTTAGQLQAGLADVLVRDAVLLSFVPGTSRVADRVLAGDGGADVGEALAAIIDPDTGIEPDRARVSAAAALLEQVVAHSAPAGQAPALTLLAVLAWWQGDGARAGILVDRALGVDPGHRLAALLREALAAGMPPGWVRRRDAGAYAGR